MGHRYEHPHGGLLATELTQPALLGAMRARHVYVSEDQHLRFVVTVNGHLCGDVLTTPGPLEVAFHLDDPDRPSCRYAIDAVLGSVGGRAAEVVKTVNLDGNLPVDAFAALDGLSLAENGQFIYFRATQTSDEGINRAWTAPVWLERSK